MQNRNNLYVLDTSAIFAYVADEPGAGRVEKILLSAGKSKETIFCSFITLTELRYITLQEHGVNEADRLLGIVKTWPVNWTFPDADICQIAADLKAANKISLADSFIAALSLNLQAALVHKDPEYDLLGKSLKFVRLPYK